MKLVIAFVGAAEFVSFLSSESGVKEKPIHAKIIATVKLRTATRRLIMVYPNSLSNIIKPESS